MKRKRNLLVTISVLAAVIVLGGLASPPVVAHALVPPGGGQVARRGSEPAAPPVNTTTATATTAAETKGPVLPTYTPQDTCAVPPGWDFFATRVTVLLGDVIARAAGMASERAAFVPLDDLLAKDVHGRIHSLGSMEGVEAAKLYLNTLPTALLASSQLSVASLHQTHYAVTCGIVSMVHQITLTPRPSPPGTPTAAAAQPSSSTTGGRGVRAMFRRLLHPSPSPASPHAPSPQHVSTTVHLWTWWRFNRDGQIREFDISMVGPADDAEGSLAGLVPWLPRDDDEPGSAVRERLVAQICARFAADGECAKRAAMMAVAAAEDPERMVRGGGAGEAAEVVFASEDECRAGLAGMSMGQLTCRALHDPVVAFAPAAACAELGRPPTVAPSPGTVCRGRRARTWSQSAAGDGAVPPIPKTEHHEL
ncbi:hypothetical protein H9P43_001136 [Blastocladiella emersonii ATCC 22665]|nr:hypothetical protein H9P43_001136 [Blastocladiella emersonii ATCC 22665]